MARPLAMTRSNGAWACSPNANRVPIARHPTVLPRRLLDIFGPLFAVSFAGQRFFRATLFARFQVEGVTLDLLDNIFLLYLAFKAT